MGAAMRRPEVGSRKTEVGRGWASRSRRPTVDGSRESESEDGSQDLAVGDYRPLTSGALSKRQTTRGGQMPNVV